MNFIKHSNLSGLHAPFSASSSAWLRYSDDKLLTVFENLKDKEIGTKLHAWAKDTIDLGINTISYDRCDRYISWYLCSYEFDGC